MAAVLGMLEIAKARSPIHDLDPRAKALWWICLIICPIVATNPIVLLALTVWVWLMAALAGIAGKMYRMLVVTYPVMVGFIILTWPFFYRGQADDHYLVEWAFVHVSWEGIIYSLAMGLRIVTALTACVFFVMTTDLMELSSALGEIAQRFGVSYTFPLMVISTFKFVPEISGDFIVIQEAFKARAVEIEQGNLWQRLRKLAPVAVPLFDVMLRHAGSIAIALELKALGARHRRTFYKEHVMCPRDYLFVFLGVAALGACVYLKVIGLSDVEVFL